MKLKSYLLALCLSSTCLHAHEDPSDVIDTLTHKIAKTTDTKELAKLYLKRSIELRALGGSDHSGGAMRDIEESLRLNPENFDAWLYKGGNTSDPSALDSLGKALKLAKSAQQKSKAEQALSEYYYGAKKIGQADIHCDKAIAHDTENDLSLILFKSHLLWKLDKLDDRVTFLTKALGKNASAVLINTWIDAHIDAGKGSVVRKIITKEMNDSRFKSSWLIRSALCEKGPAAKVYAQQAVTEIKSRLNLDRPDVTLLMDLARAYAILGEHEKAEFYTNRAKQLAHDKWAMNELEEKIKPVKEKTDKD